ncbi:MAG: sulfatase [Kiritimatiellia bacterium]|jgi:arylsulfatase A-like enzyme|nr:sulfatase [Kiritimatiellia bacterium]
MMNYIKMTIAASALLACCCVTVNAQEKTSPNIIFILADDLGWADTTLYGHTKLYPTPNIARLAKRGMTFTRAYSNSPLCSPTRASLLTGQTPARHGSTRPEHHIPGVVRLKAVVDASAPPGVKARSVSSVTRLDTRFPTLGKLFKAKGYQTAHFGKWHLGHDPYTPLNHGFDVSLPHAAGSGPAGGYLAPWKYKELKNPKPNEHIEDRMAQEATQWFDSLQSDRPFFMNYWQFSVHAPFQAKEELIEMYRKKIDPKDAQRSALYAAMVHSLDDAVGTLLDMVDAAGIADNTIIVFYSDNGGHMYAKLPDAPSATSNRPLRGGKGTIFEGGIRVPAIVVWPGVTTPGSRSDEPIQTSDFYPTFAQQLGLDVPGDHVVDGLDILPVLKGGKLDRDAIFTYFPFAPQRVPDWLPDSVCVHAGDWKLIRLFHGGEDGKHGYRLYNLAEDLGETTDLSSQYPERVASLDKKIEEYLTESNAVVPLPNPAFDPAQYRPELVGVPGAKSSKKKGKRRK